MSQDWRIETNAEDYFGHQKKKSEVEQRRPVIRRAADLVGPGVGANTVRVTNWNDLLATFDGYFSSVAGAAGAPTSTEAFVGFVTSDAALGGVQTATGMTTGVQYTRVFNRNAADPETIGFTDWVATTEVGSILRLNEWPLSLNAETWTASSVRNPLSRGTALIMPEGNYGAIQVLRSGWYEVGAQCSFDSAPSRAVLRIVVGSNPDENMQAIQDVPSAGASYQALNVTGVNYFEAGTILRTLLWSSAVSSTSQKFFYARQV